MRAVPNQRERVAPGAGQESVWDYPRPPRLERTSELLRVRFAGEPIAETVRGYRVLETSHPPVYYFPAEDVRTEFLLAAKDRSFCEFKGLARYWTLDVRGARSERAAWSYPDQTAAFLAIKHFFAFCASRVDELGRNRAGGVTGGRFLWRLDHIPDRRTVQGRAGDIRMVTFGEKG
jgi:uncharacterized protein (DUF427 family)